jgi:hypothetical protein
MLGFSEEKAAAGLPHSKMENADVKSALQKKSPGQRPGRSFL